MMTTLADTRFEELRLVFLNKLGGKLAEVEKDVRFVVDSVDEPGRI